jgi:Sulfotransferase family
MSASTSRGGPLFVVGSPRSGTSLLYYLLAAHPDLAYPDIGLKRLRQSRTIRALGRLGLPVYRSAALHGIFLPRPGETPYERDLHGLGLDPCLPQEGAFVWSDLAARAGLAVRELSPEALRARPRLGPAIRRRYADLLARTGRPRFVDKSPTYTVILEALRELYPDAHVIHIIRDGRAVVNSVAYGLKYRKRRDGARSTRTWWGPPPPNERELAGRSVVERACHQWAYLVAEGRRGGALFGPDRYHELRYRDLVSRTREVVGRLFERVRLPPVPDAVCPERLQNRNYKWKDRSGSFGDPIWTDRSAIEPEDYPRLEILRDLLESLGDVAPGAELVGPPPGERATAGGPEGG